MLMFHNIQPLKPLQLNEVKNNNNNNKMAHFGSRNNTISRHNRFTNMALAGIINTVVTLSAWLYYFLFHVAGELHTESLENSIMAFPISKTHRIKAEGLV